MRLGTSAGGQRAKAIIAYNKKTGEVRSGQLKAPKGFDYYLIKLDGVSATAALKETENFGRLEYSFAKLVKNGLYRQRTIWLMPTIQMEHGPLHIKCQ